MLSALITILVIAQFFFDFGYYLKAFTSLYIGKWFQKRINITDTAVYYGICTTRDADSLLLHMNNARYVRLTDAAKFNFWARTGVIDKRSYYKLQMVVGANTVRYRRPIRLFDLYKIETKLLYLDEKTLTSYIEHKFITLKDEFVRAIVLSRNHILGVGSESVLADLPGAYNTPTKMPEEIRQWEESMQTISGKIRRKGH